MTFLEFNQRCGRPRTGAEGQNVGIVHKHVTTSNRITVPRPVFYMSFFNFFDAFLVWGTGVLLVWVLEPLSISAGFMRNLTVLRAFRLMRVARVVKNMAMFKEMWMLLKGLVDSLLR